MLSPVSIIFPNEPTPVHGELAITLLQPQPSKELGRWLMPLIGGLPDRHPCVMKQHIEGWALAAKGLFFHKIREAENKNGLHRCKPFVLSGVPNEIRTRVIAVKGRCPRPLDDGDL